ncbi:MULTISPECIES: 30S ribosomal protein S2 [Caldisericum]|jgi:small subunit ribosomal protein S2|uniref:30S ribosomal protein S2 n=1 Tax=Caldisericum TaxID=693074 RepID=UPI000CC5CF24|nr:MAG: 30S ribosomal protein S2 [Fervidicoccus fontis]
MSVVSMKELLEAGVHFGHQTKRWDPRMKEYIFTERNGIHIFDLRLTVKKIEEAYKFVVDITRQGGKIIFVGTKKAAQDIVKEEAERCGMPYVNERWVGGLLTNFQTVRKSINRLKELEKLETEGYFDTISVKERVKLERELAKLRKLYAGLKDMVTLPWAIFVTDTHKERSAILEARKIKIPIIGICDTNSNPEEIDYPIPGNDDAIRSLRLITSIIANAVIEGREGKIEREETQEEVTEEELLTKEFDFEEYEDYKK